MKTLPLNVTGTTVRIGVLGFLGDSIPIPNLVDMATVSTANATVLKRFSKIYNQTIYLIQFSWAHPASTYSDSVRKLMDRYISSIRNFNSLLILFLQTRMVLQSGSIIESRSRNVKKFVHELHATIGTHILHTLDKFFQPRNLRSFLKNSSPEQK